MNKPIYTSVIGSMAQRFCTSLIGGGKLLNPLLVLAVFFIFGLSSCSSDDSIEEAETTSTRVSDINALLVSHDWEVTEASVRSGLTAFDILNGRTYCHFSYNTAKFSREEISYTLNGTPEGIVTVPAGEYVYAVKEGTITIDNQIFTVSAFNNDTTLVLENEGCKLVLVGKEEGRGL